MTLLDQLFDIDSSAGRGSRRDYVSGVTAANSTVSCTGSIDVDGGDLENAQDSWLSRDERDVTARRLGRARRRDESSHRRGVEKRAS